MTIKVRHEPRTEIIIHEIAKFDSAQKFIDFITTGVQGQAGVAEWINGVVLIFTVMPMTNEMSKERLQGHLHWDYVACASMKEYKETMQSSNKQATIAIRDVSNNESFAAIGKFLLEEILISKK